MRLVSQSNEGWEYQLNRTEADILAGLVKQFPVAGLAAAQISKAGKEPETAEREKMLNESLAEHRKELTKLAVNLLAEEKWKRSEKGHLLTLDSHSREILLQILNDIRVGCWRALGEPEMLDAAPPRRSTKAATLRHLMDLAGYFEMNLLEPEG